MKPSADRIARGLYWDRAWSLVEGCTPVSAACDNCWAAQAAHMRKGHPDIHISMNNSGITTGGGQFSGVVRTRDDLIDQPLEVKKPAVWAVWTELFHQTVSPAFQQAAFEVIKSTPRHLYIILTKRQGRLLRFAEILNDKPLPNLWLGVTAEDQEAANTRIPFLLQAPAAKRFISAEPMLGPVDLATFLPQSVPPDKNDGTGYLTQGLDWVVCGGESGSGARPIHPDWARSLRDQCKAAGAPFWFKGWGRHVPAGQTKGLLDGVECREWPE